MRRNEMLVVIRCKECSKSFCKIRLDPEFYAYQIVLLCNESCFKEVIKLTFLFREGKQDHSGSTLEVRRFSNGGKELK